MYKKPIKTIIPCFYCALFLPPILHTKSNLYLANTLAAAISAPALYRLLTFQVPSTMSLFLLRLRDTSSRNTPPEIRVGEWFTSGFVSSEIIFILWVILNICFLRRGVVSTSLNPLGGGPPLVGCPRLLI